MNQYIGLDVSLKDTAISIRQAGKRAWRGKCPSDPKLLAQMIRKHAPHATRVVFETGPLSTWFYHSLTAEGIPAVCIERGLMKTFGLIVPKGTGRVFDGNVRKLVDGNHSLARIILPLLEAWRDIRKRAVDLAHQLLAAARESQATKLLMTIPGVGAVTAVSYVAAIEDPENFRTSRSVGAWLGLTTRRYQSGEIDYNSHISRRGDNHLRGLLYEAATVLLTRTTTKTECSLRDWGLKLRERLGFKRAAVAVARKLAVNMHSMLKTGEVFNPSAGAPA